MTWAHDLSQGIIWSYPVVKHQLREKCLWTAGMGSIIQVDDLDEDNFVVKSWRSIRWKLSKHITGQVMTSVIPVAEMESLKYGIFSLISIMFVFKNLIKSLQVRALGMQGLIEWWLSVSLAKLKRILGLCRFLLLILNSNLFLLGKGPSCILKGSPARPDVILPV